MRSIASAKGEVVRAAKASRRSFIEASVAWASAVALKGAPEEAVARLNPAKDGLLHNSASRLAELIRTKAISSKELVQASLSRIAELNGPLNAVCQLDPEGALRAAREADAALGRGDRLGPLHGVPLTIKDSFDTAGMISAAGTSGRSRFIPAQDATVVRRLRGAGAIILGKTNTPELTLGYETDNLVYGRTSNPFDRSRTCGGSSGGAAAVVSACGSAAEIGSDTAGSIRVPAAFCGVAGLKPSRGLVSRAGHIIPPGGVVGCRTHVGPIARSVRDLAVLLSIISGPDARDAEAVPVVLKNLFEVEIKSLRVAFFTQNGKSTPDPGIVRAVQDAARILGGLGAPLEERTIPGFDLADPILQVLNSGDGGDYYRKLLRQCGTDKPHPATAAFIETIRSGVVSGRKYSDVLLDWGRLQEAALGFMQEFEILVCPVCSAPAPKHGGSGGIDFSWSYLFNLLGWPAAVVRAGTSPEGLPLGVQIVGRPWKDHEAMAAALAIEQGLGGWKPV